MFCFHAVDAGCAREALPPTEAGSIPLPVRQFRKEFIS